MKKVILIIAALLYAFSPFDIIPDLILGWGWIDDVVVLSLLLRYILTGRLPPFFKLDLFHYMFKFLSICSSAAKEKKFDPRNTGRMPAVKIFSALNLK